MANEERARFVGGPMDGQLVEADEENPTLPETAVFDGGKGPAGYGLVRGEPNTEWIYVVDHSVADAYMKEIWGDNAPVERQGEQWLERRRDE